MSPEDSDMSQSPEPIICRKLFDVEEFAPRWSITDVGAAPGHEPSVMLCFDDRYRSSSWQTTTLQEGRTCVSRTRRMTGGTHRLWPFNLDTWLYFRIPGRDRPLM